MHEQPSCRPPACRQSSPRSPTRLHAHKLRVSFVLPSEAMAWWAGVDTARATEGAVGVLGAGARGHGAGAGSEEDVCAPARGTWEGTGGGGRGAPGASSVLRTAGLSGHISSPRHRVCLPATSSQLSGSPCPEPRPVPHLPRPPSAAPSSCWPTSCSSTPETPSRRCCPSRRPESR